MGYNVVSRILTLAAFLAMGSSCTQAQDPDQAPPPTDSAAAAFRAAVGHLTSPAFEERKARRLQLQRRGYASILHRAAARDPWGAILALLKMEAQLDFHLPSNTLVTTIVMEQPPSAPRGPASLAPPSPPRYVQFPLIEDRRFPRDPWRK